MNSLRPVFVLLITSLLLLGQPALGAAEILQPGAKLDSLPVGPVTYTQVQVRSYNTRTLMITHAGGMASIRLRDLAPEWQARFNYDPALEAAADEAAKTAPPTTPAPAKTKTPVAKGPTMNLSGLLQQFGKPAVLKPEVDLRATFIQLELYAKNQGHRPSCSVFAVVSALEFENARLTGRPEKFSEEYLIWAVRKTTQRTPLVATPLTVSTNNTDEGYSLEEVVTALRAYGIPPQASMPNTFGSAIESIENPPPAVIREAKEKQRVFVHILPGRDNTTRINNLIHALNAQLPVVVGMEWPNYRSLGNGYLDAQQPMKGEGGVGVTGHAVTLVGYKSITGHIEDAIFVFKNSWGVKWGQGGYGVVTYKYLNAHLNDAVLLEVLAG